MHEGPRPQRLGLWAAAVVWSFVACLPEGEPGIGRKLLSARGIDGVELAPTPTNLAGHFAVAAVLKNPRASGQEAREASSKVVWGLSMDASAPPFALSSGAAVPTGGLWDSEGRLFTRSTDDNGIRLVDLEKQIETPLESDTASVLMVEGGRWALLPQSTGAVLRGQDGTRVFLSSMPSPIVDLGGALYYLIRQNLMRLLPGQATPATIARGVLHFAPVKAGTDEDGIFVLTTPGPSGFIAGLQRWDSKGGMLTPLPLTQLIGYSRFVTDGSIVAALDVGTANSLVLNILTLATGAVERTVIEVGAVSIERSGTAKLDPVFIDRSLAIRPGSRDVYGSLGAGNGAPARTFIKRAEDAPMLVNARAYFPNGVELGPGERDRFLDYPIPNWTFTSDGRFWVYYDNKGLLQLSRATGDRTQIQTPLHVPVDDGVETFVEVDPGNRLVLLTQHVSHDHSNVYVVDLTDPDITTRSVATMIDHVRPGKERLLAIAREVGHTGDLVLIDYATGKERVLAQNVIRFDSVPLCPSCDPTGPGTKIVYSVQARVPFKYDGVWGAVLP